MQLFVANSDFFCKKLPADRQSECANWRQQNILSLAMWSTFDGGDAMQEAQATALNASLPSLGRSPFNPKALDKCASDRVADAMQKDMERAIQRDPVAFYSHAVSDEEVEQPKAFR
ncbi:MAG TPA: hypothetical protein VG124_16425 [Beijerinckiaceae bacterium]|nr:hypothetical protein [Beijerinckiaceae bacterium]